MLPTPHPPHPYTCHHKEQVWGGHPWSTMTGTDNMASPRSGPHNIFNMKNIRLIQRAPSSLMSGTVAVKSVCNVLEMCHCFPAKLYIMSSRDMPQGYTYLHCLFSHRLTLHTTVEGSPWRSVALVYIVSTHRRVKGAPPSHPSHKSKKKSCFRKGPLKCRRCSLSSSHPC